MATWKTDDDATRALRAYLRAVAFAEPLQAAVREKYGVRLAGLRALRILRDLGRVPISRFAEALSIPRSTATGVVDRLEERGLVERAFDPVDRRMINIRITARGLAALEDRALIERSTIGERIRALAPGQQQLLAALLEAIIGDGTFAGPSAAETAGAMQEAR
jgi:DNA-binding MarR family transcriptional regulator